jgi:hypothetical protein
MANFKQQEIGQINVKEFNLKYEEYNKESLNGLKVATVINKAIDLNETNEIPRNEKGFYILDDEKSVEIYITMTVNETTYKMETLYGLGLDKFIKSFGSAEFKCTDIKYHEKTGRVASMTFETQEY